MVYRRAFTIAEMAVALGIGMFIVQVAYMSLSFSQKFIAKTQQINQKNSLAKAMLMYSSGGGVALSGCVVGGVGGVVAVGGQLPHPAGSVTTSFLQEVTVREQVGMRMWASSGTHVTITTSAPHGLLAGQTVEVSHRPSAFYAGVFDGWWVVSSVVTPRSFTVPVVVPVTPNANYDYDGFVVRLAGAVTKRQRASGVVTLYTAGNHGLRAGQWVEVNGAAAGDLSTHGYCGRFIIRSVTATTFMYDNDSRKSPAFDEGLTNNVSGPNHFRGYQTNILVPSAGG